MNPAMVKSTLEEAMQIEGALGVALVDYKSGLTLGTAGGGPTLNLDIAAAGNTEVVKAKMKVMNQLGIKEKIEDVLITLNTQYHLVRMVTESTSLFIYLVLSKERSNLGMARYQLSAAETKLA